MDYIDDINEYLSDYYQCELIVMIKTAQSKFVLLGNQCLGTEVSNLDKKKLKLYMEVRRCSLNRLNECFFEELFDLEEDELVELENHNTEFGDMVLRLIKHLTVKVDDK